MIKDITVFLSFHLCYFSMILLDNHDILQIAVTFSFKKPIEKWMIRNAIKENLFIDDILSKLTCFVM